MKSIEDTLSFLKKILSGFDDATPTAFALVGGYAGIAHGIGRTTTDVDLAVFSETIHSAGIGSFARKLETALPPGFIVHVVEGSKIHDDPFRHDILFLEDTSREYPKIDLIVPRYKWELEGLERAGHLEDIPFPVLPKPYLVAMKLRAGSPKDDSDILELVQLMSPEEKSQTDKLAKRVHRDQKLNELLVAGPPPRDDDDPELLA